MPAMLTGAGGAGYAVAAQLLDLALDEALGQRRNRQERIHAQRARNHGAVGHRKTLVYAAIAREDAPVTGPPRPAGSRRPSGSRPADAR